MYTHNTSRRGGNQGNPALRPVGGVNSMKKHIMRTGIIALAVILLLALMAAAAPRASQEAVVDGVTYEFEILEGNNVSITDINVPDSVTAVKIPGTITSGEET